MRFTVAWADVISENYALKLALGCLTVVLVVLSIVSVKLANRKALVIERACYSRALPTVNGDRTPAEVETFIRQALAMRFDTYEQVSPGFLSSDEEKFRSQEQQELKERGISQRVFVNSVTVSGDQVSVDADRLFSVGSVRSVLSFPVVLSIGTVSRTEGNPYGLIVLQVSASKQSEKTKGRSQ